MRSRIDLVLVATVLCCAPVTADVYVTSRSAGAILVFADDANGDAAPLRQISGPSTGIVPGQLNGITVDAVHGEVFVSLGTGAVLVFAADADGDVAPLRTIQGSNTGLAFTAGLAVDPWNDELWVVNATDDALFVFARTATGNVAPLRTIAGPATGIEQPTGVFVDLSADEVYLTNEASSGAGYGVFARLANGNTAPLRRVAGPATTFTFATGVFRNPQTGEVYVADLFSDRVLVFAQSATGNVAPSRTIASPDFDRPGGITLTNTFELLVVDIFADAVITLDVDASGPAVPAAQGIQGPSTGLDLPIYCASTESPFPGAVAAPIAAASLATRNAGTNPASLTASGPPALDSTMTLSVDLTTTGDTEAFVLFYTGQASLVVPNSGGAVLLVGGVPLATLGPGGAPMPGFPIVVPRDYSLVGFALSAQAVHVTSGSLAFALSNAVDVVVGL